MPNILPQQKMPKLIVVAGREIAVDAARRQWIHVARRCLGIWEADMPELHARGVELVIELLEAADEIDRMSSTEMQRLLRETAEVLGDLVRRDRPPETRPRLIVHAKPGEADRHWRVRSG